MGVDVYANWTKGWHCTHVAARWRHVAYHVTPAKGSARVPKVTDATRHGDECEWYQQKDVDEANLMRTFAVRGNGRCRGRKAAA